MSKRIFLTPLTMVVVITVFVTFCATFVALAHILRVFLADWKAVSSIGVFKLCKSIDKWMHSFGELAVETKRLELEMKKAQVREHAMKVQTQNAEE